MRMKLSELLATKKVVASGFSAIEGLSAHSKGTEEVVLSSLPPSDLLTQGVTEYYALEIPRGTVFATAEDIIVADLPVRKYMIDLPQGAAYMDIVIVSRHKGTVDELLERYEFSVGGGQEIKVLEAVTADDIRGKHVIGTLPPYLITVVGAYTAVTIKDFDYIKDGDLHGEELAQRMVVADKPLILREIPAN